MSNTVSVVLPYFNRADTLGRAVKSVLNQTHEDLILYLVDDGSTDDSRRVAHELSDSRIRWVDLPTNGGACVARNAGLNQAATSLVAFMDSDDEWLPHKLERQVAELRARQAQGESVSVLGCAWTQARTNGSGRVFPAGPFTFAKMLQGVAGTGTPMLLVDRDVAAKGASFDSSFPSLEERDFVLSCLANGSLLAVLPEVLVTVYRGRSDHLANATKASEGWERYLSKYAEDLSRDGELLSYYHYRAAREFLVAGLRKRAVGHVRPALRYLAFRRSIHLALGAGMGVKGLALAQKVKPL